MATAAVTRPRRTGADLGALVETLAFDPVLHFQVHVGASQRLSVRSRSRAPLYLAQGADLTVRHPPSGWQGTLREGELLFLPQGGAHEVATDPDAPPVSVMDLARAPLHNGRGTFVVEHPAPVASVVGTFFWTSDLMAQPLIAQLPPVVHLRRGGCGSERWLAPMAQLMRWMTDLRHGGHGVGMTETVLALLRHVMLATLTHDAHRVHEPDAMPCAGTPHDPALLPALQAIHTQPSQAWTVDRLAALCHMSRTAFHARFVRATGRAPFRYLTRWRMNQARRLLDDSILTLDQVAERVGYSSGFALSKAYKREMHKSPRAA